MKLHAEGEKPTEGAGRKRHWSIPPWTKAYALSTVGICAFFALALDCADAATCSAGRFQTAAIIGITAAALFVLFMIERYFRSEK
jgi:hypothetical protein